MFWSAGILVKSISKTFYVFCQVSSQQNSLESRSYFPITFLDTIGHVNKRNLQLIRYLIDSIIVLSVVFTSTHYYVLFYVWTVFCQVGYGVSNLQIPN